MPLEIRELIIKTQIVTQKSNHDEANERISVADRKALVEECVEKVLSKLDRKKER